MRIIGVIVEYNPFHLGHLYQINKIKEKYPDVVVVVVVSSCFTQRGDISIMSKWDKAKVALDNGVDLVLELPFVYATQAADIFAKGAITILNKIGIDTLVFGSETDDSNYFKEMAATQFHDDYGINVKRYLDKGVNYPTALALSLKDSLGYSVNTPNDLLGLSYVKEIIKNNYNIEVVPIKRTNDYHGDKIDSNIVNASLIRKLLTENKDVTSFLPNYDVNSLIRVSREDFFYLLKYQIIVSKEKLDQYQTVDEGLENRIINEIQDSNTWEELVMRIKTKRYTYNKINRMLVHILTGFTKDEAKRIDTHYIRVLGFSKMGRNYLNKIKKEIDIPIITHYKKGISSVLDIEFRVTQIYDMIVKRDLIKKEYSQKPIIRD